MFIFYILLCFTFSSIGSFIYQYTFHQTNRYSICPKCHHPLSILDLVPIISYILLKGKCRYCKQSISSSYLFVEILFTIIGLILYRYYGISIHLIFSYFIFILLFLLSVEDIKTMMIDIRLIGIIGILEMYIQPFSLILAVTGCLICIPLFLFRNYIGSGDVYFLLMSACVLGIFRLALLLLIASILGLLSAYIRKNRKIPFIPYLSVAYLMIRLYGNTIIEWFMKG